MVSTRRVTMLQFNLEAFPEIIGHAVALGAPRVADRLPCCLLLLPDGMARLGPGKSSIKRTICFVEIDIIIPMEYQLPDSGQVTMGKKADQACDRCRKGHQRCQEVKDLGCQRCRAKGVQCQFSRPSVRATPVTAPEDVPAVGPTTPPVSQNSGQMAQEFIADLGEDPLGSCSWCVEGSYVCLYHSEQEVEV
ncbi:hypothetical protein FIBSPDRAFT_369553 [Athelia psychrophila]|uniref:Zn(2)-C6 fungal-type domain-containing protein n=1 Tax=Athelia psychrophila TaxID=1759441 RepID=A0A166PAE1_9AGAM|nr:hypothetical protein FIBSPDRAFT_369553 [Fibularhizoctonia sp. CBS 109695]